MKTEHGGEPIAEDTITRNLARLFDEELERAERDFATPRTPLAAAIDGRRSRGRSRVKLAVGALGAVAVAAIVVASAWLVYSPEHQTAGPASALGKDGIPNSIDGERVYRVSDKAEWQTHGGTFLLGGFVYLQMADCPVALAAATDPAHIGIRLPCGGYGLSPTVVSTADGIPAADGILVGYQSPEIIGAWLDTPVVARVKNCRTDDGSPCPPVVESVVWPEIPTEVAGERVYRATDRPVFAGIEGGFLLGGVFLKPTVVPSCPSPNEKSAAEQQLVPYCPIRSVDGLTISPMGSIDAPRFELVVVRVHVNDPLAAECPIAALADCKAAIVVESVVWRSDVLITARPSAGPAGSSAATNASPSASIGPSAQSSAAAGSPDPSASPLDPPPPPSPTLPPPVAS